MECCSKFALLRDRSVPEDLVDHGFDSEEEVDTNVFSLKFNLLKAGENNLFMGDPLFCNECKSVLSMISVLYSPDEYQAMSNKKGSQEEEKEDAKKIKNVFIQKETIPLEKLKKSDKVWICEFCGTHNVVSVEPEEIPKEGDVYYLLQSSDQLKSKVKTEVGTGDESVIFCIDNSGSMCVTSEIKSKNIELNFGISEEERRMLQQFIEYGADQFLPNQSKKSTWVSRKQCVSAAIENQLQELAKTHPERKVGLVVFNDDVCIIGDGLKDPITIAGDKLLKKEVCFEEASSNYQNLLSNPVSKSADKIISKLQKLQEKGTTALGPALLSSIGLAANGKPGSMVIVCTDGLANIGLGRMDNPEVEEEASKFYEEVGKLAKERGIVVSVITIKGEGCKVDTISQIADLTGGSVTRVNPDKIHEDFSNILKEELVGRDVDVKIRLHNFIKFRNEEKAFLAEDDSLYHKNIGNITAGTELTFEYTKKSSDELKKIGVGLDQLKEIPFQSVITYTSVNGSKMMRVITIKLKVTQELDDAGRNVNMKMLAARAAQVTSNQAEGGDLIKAKKVNKKWTNFLSNDVVKLNEDNADIKRHFKNFQDRNTQLVKVMNKNVKRRIRRNSIKLIQEIDDLGENDQNSLASDLDNLSNEGSDDEDAANYFKFKRCNSITYNRSVSRSNSPDKKDSSLDKKSIGSYDSRGSTPEKRSSLSPPQGKRKNSMSPARKNEKKAAGKKSPRVQSPKPQSKPPGFMDKLKQMMGKK